MVNEGDVALTTDETPRRVMDPPRGSQSWAMIDA